MKKRVLVYPCGTEIGLEIYRAVNKSIHFQLIGGSSNYDHGQFVYKDLINDLPFITDDSSKEDIVAFNQCILNKRIDFIYPAMDGVVYAFAKYRQYLKPVVIAPDYKTAAITRSKSRTYEYFADTLKTPSCYEEIDEIAEYPVFVKPDVGQGSVGTAVVKSSQELRYLLAKKLDLLILEYLPGEEYTIDCFTNSEGKLVYARGRTRKRIKNGISVNAVFYDEPEFGIIAEKINKQLNQRGGWFFQLKRDRNGALTLLEIASRIAGTSSITRNTGVNLPLLTLHLFNGNSIHDVLINPYDIELDRALYNKYHLSLSYDTVYFDYDDTIVIDSRINTQIMAFVFQCINNGKHLVLLTKHKGDIFAELRKYRLETLFDQVMQLDATEEKAAFIMDSNSILIDDSYGERLKIASIFHIPTFDTHMIECLLEEND